MNEKLSRILLIAINLAIVANTCAYVYGPVRDRLILYGLAYKFYFQCEKNFTEVRAALALGISVPGVPLTPISSANVSFLLYTRKNPKIPQVLHANDPIKSLKASNLDTNKGIVMYAHGYNTPFDSGAREFTSRLLPYQDINVIIIDWDSYDSFNLSYTARITYPRLGGITATLLRKFMQIGTNPKKINLVGYSAGGEIVALAGQQLNPKVGRITAFDPQGACYSLSPPTKRISKRDADFVQIVHCSLVGVFPTINGDVSFIINGGILQPQCDYLTDFRNLSQCSHRTCQDRLFDSLSQNASLTGVKCDNYLDYLLNKCNYRDRLILRYDVPISARGTYYVNTLPFQNRDPSGY